MNRYISSKAVQGYGRANDIALKEEQKDAIVNIGIAHLAVGNCAEFMLSMGAVNKVDVTHDLSNKIDQLGQVLSTVQGKLGITTPTETPNGVANGVTNMETSV